MKICKLMKRCLIGCLLLTLLTGCAPASPELSFDGESCTYQGPTDLKSGSTTLLFRNQSGVNAVVCLLRLAGDKTIQDMIDFIGEEPSMKQTPSWGLMVVEESVPPGTSYTWEGSLRAGIHTVVCATISPPGVWFGTGLTVED
jgi:hypothetical protein